MKFGWINVIGAAIVILMLIPNIIYALKNRDEKNLCKDYVSWTALYDLYS